MSDVAPYRAEDTTISKTPTVHDVHRIPLYDTNPRSRRFQAIAIWVAVPLNQLRNSASRPDFVREVTD